ncbi:hypothetical protein WICPIJ_008644 [Wickerhamomyces pijperi]|uniref:UBX domain-containing protein 1 n=1 Tax=Wickerhamomyces pijperi TaxID=599730 RepID=A0A9P8PW59_WICPI|nr:hypothetical protein WICPIJ_008644 [Wickerhamomyces pijperi]
MYEKEAIETFITLTGTSEASAREFLEHNNWDLETAVEEFYGNRPKNQSEAPQSSTKAPTHTASKSNKRSSNFKSFQELIKGEDNGDDDDDEQNFFAGGGRGSGLEVENPDSEKNSANKLVRDLLKKAESNEQRPGGDDEISPEDHFEGVGYRLGDYTTPSKPVGSAAIASKKAKKVTREITFWKDGFQVGDGQLYRYDDPANASYLADLNSGRAPMALLDVQYGQEVDVNVQRKLDEEYQPPKRKLGGFTGSGNRLGSVIPSETPIEDAPIAKVTTAPNDEAIVEPKGDTKIQIRLADGRKIVLHLNSTDSVSSLYELVTSETSGQRQFYLATSFPVKSIENSSTSIKDAGLCNSVIVQRWS